MLVHYFPYSAWEEFRDLIPENERGCFVNAYHKRLNSDNLETQVRFLFWFFIYAFFLNDIIFPKKKFIPAVKLCVRARVYHAFCICMLRRHLVTKLCCPLVLSIIAGYGFCLLSKP